MRRIRIESISCFIAFTFFYLLNPHVLFGNADGDELNLVKTKLQGFGKDLTIEELKTLESIGFGNSEIKDADLVHLKALKGLKHLNLSMTDITDSGLLHIKELGSLQTLSLGWTKITNDGLAHLKKNEEPSGIDCCIYKDRG